MRVSADARVRIMIEGSRIFSGKIERRAVALKCSRTLFFTPSILLVASIAGQTVNVPVVTYSTGCSLSWSEIFGFVKVQLPVSMSTAGGWLSHFWVAAVGVRRVGCCFGFDVNAWVRYLE